MFVIAYSLTFFLIISAVFINDAFRRIYYVRKVGQVFSKKAVATILVVYAMESIVVITTILTTNIKPHRPGNSEITEVIFLDISFFAATFMMGTLLYKLAAATSTN